MNNKASEARKSSKYSVVLTTPSNKNYQNDAKRNSIIPINTDNVAFNSPSKNKTDFSKNSSINLTKYTKTPGRRTLELSEFSKINMFPSQSSTKITSNFKKSALTPTNKNKNEILSSKYLTLNTEKSKDASTSSLNSQEKVKPFSISPIRNQQKSSESIKKPSCMKITNDNSKDKSNSFINIKVKPLIEIIDRMKKSIPHIISNSFSANRASKEESDKFFNDCDRLELEAGELTQNFKEYEQVYDPNSKNNASQRPGQQAMKGIFLSSERRITVYTDLFVTCKSNLNEILLLINYQSNNKISDVENSHAIHTDKSTVLTKSERGDLVPEQKPGLHFEQSENDQLDSNKTTENEISTNKANNFNNIAQQKDYTILGRNKEKVSEDSKGSSIFEENLQEESIDYGNKTNINENVRANKPYVKNMIVNKHKDDFLWQLIKDVNEVHNEVNLMIIEEDMEEILKKPTKKIKFQRSRSQKFFSSLNSKKSKRDYSKSIKNNNNFNIDVIEVISSDSISDNEDEIINLSYDEDIRDLLWRVNNHNNKKLKKSSTKYLMSKTAKGNLREMQIGIQNYENVYSQSFGRVIYFNIRKTVPLKDQKA